MEINLVSSFTFNTSADAKFAHTLLSPSPDTPYNIGDVKKKHLNIFKALEAIDFSQDSEINKTCIECEWTFFDMDAVSAHLDAFEKLKTVVSYHIVSTDDEDPSYLATILDAKRSEYEEWNKIPIDEWDAAELFMEVKTTSEQALKRLR